MKIVSLSKLKKQNGQLIDTPLKASLIFSPEGKSYHLVIESTTTHTPHFTGMILSAKSEFKLLHGKMENLEIRCFKYNSEAKKLDSHIVKIQIANDEKNDSK